MEQIFNRLRQDPSGASADDVCHGVRTVAQELLGIAARPIGGHENAVYYTYLHEVARKLAPIVQALAHLAACALGVDHILLEKCGAIMFSCVQAMQAYVVRAAVPSCTDDMRGVLLEKFQCFVCSELCRRLP